MWILFRLVLVLIGIMYRLIGHKFRKVQLVEAKNGLMYQFKLSRDKKKNIYKTEILIPVKTGLFFRLVPEKKWLRFCKKIGLGSEIQTGDTEFDNLFYVESDHPAFLKKLRSETNLIELLKRFSEKGYKKITSDGRGYLRLVSETNSEENLDEKILIQLLELKQQIDSIKVSFTDIDIYSIRYFLLELFFFICAGYAFGMYIEFNFDDRLVHLDPWDLAQKGIMIGLAIFLGWILTAIIILKNSSRAPKLLSEFIVLLLLSLILGGAQAMMDLNIALDKSPRTVTIARILDRQKVTTGSGKSRRTNTYLILSFDKNPLNIPEELKISNWDSLGLTKGQGAKISTRNGFFNSPYIEEVETCEPPTQGLEPKTPEAKYLKELHEIASWNPEIEDMRFVKLTWKEEKYRSGKIRSREPIIGGKKNGLASYWHENGELYSNIPWKNDLKEGRFNLYREDGTLEQSLNYKEGEPHGLLSWFDEKENLKQRAVYKNGVQIQVDQKTLEELANLEK